MYGMYRCLPAKVGGGPFFVCNFYGGKRMRIIFVLGCMLLCSSCGVSLRASLYGAKDIPIYKVAPEHRRYSEVSLVAGEDTELPADSYSE